MRMLFKNANIALIGSLFIVSAAYADSVTPEEPDAYEDFVIEIEFSGAPGKLTPHYLDVRDNTIMIGYRSTPAGFIPPEFSPLTVTIPGLPPGTYTAKTFHMSDSVDDSLDDILIDYTELEFTVAEAVETQHVYAFFHPSIEHYFVTASDDEADEVMDQTWEMVDFGFNVWGADDLAPPSAVPVCRFYSSQVNSHFYTGDEEECTKLQEEDHGWEYEGIAFQALIPNGGACPAGTDPVWRLFNDRVAEKDSNHRFVASSETYRAMMAHGWLGEGVAFCSPPAVE